MLLRSPNVLVTVLVGAPAPPLDNGGGEHENVVVLERRRGEAAVEELAPELLHKQEVDRRVVRQISLPLLSECPLVHLGRDAKGNLSLVGWGKLGASSCDRGF